MGRSFYSIVTGMAMAGTSNENLGVSLKKKEFCL
jgi:hypothetical protein